MARLNYIRRWVIWIGLVLFVVGAKLWLIDYAGSSVPRWDQIDGEGETVLRPWLNGTLQAGDLWRPHNEHRIVFTKLQSLALVKLNGQWDAYVQMFTNAVLHAALLPVLLSWIHRRVQGWAFGVLTVMASALWALPLTWENTLQGFQSPFYILIWLSFLQIRGVLGADRFGWSWWGGQVCGLLALGAMGSGMLSSVAVLAVTLVETARTREITPLRIATAAVSTLWILLGWLSRTPFPGHDPLRVQTFGEAVDGIARTLTWPLQEWLPYSIAAALPLAGLAILWWRKPQRDDFERTLLGLAVWFGLIATATVWLRYNGALLSSRYLDQFIIGLILQGCALVLIPLPRAWRIGLLAIWVAAVGTAVQRDVADITEKTLPLFKRRIAVQEANTRAFLADPRPELLRDKGNFELPHPSGEVLWMRWQHPEIRRILPAAVRSPVSFPPVEPDLVNELPPAPYPIIAASPTERQQEPWGWRSERQSADTLPILRFRFNGELGDPRAALSMRVVSDAWSVEITPDGPAPNRWKTINVIRPPGEWWIELSDRDSAASVALTAPVELGWFSWATEKAIKYHLWWMGVGLALLLAGLLALIPVRIMPPPAA